MFLVIITGTKVWKRLKFFLLVLLVVVVVVVALNCSSIPDQLTIGTITWIPAPLFPRMIYRRNVRESRQEDIPTPAPWRRIRGNYVPSGKTHLKHAARAGGRAQPDKYLNENALLQRQFLVRIVLQLIREAVRSDRGGRAVNASGCNAMTPFLFLLLTSELPKEGKQNG